MYKLALAAAATAATASATAAPAGWKLVSRDVQGDIDLTFPIKNTDPSALEAAFKEHTKVGGPSRKHYSLEEVAALVGNPAGARQVAQVLAQAGARDVHTTKTNTWVTATLSEEDAERLMKADYALFKHDVTGQETIRTLEHTIPSSIEAHVDFVTGLRFPPVSSGPVLDGTATGTVTPAYLRDFYNVDIDTASADASISLLGAIGQSYDPDDVTAFDKLFDIDETDINLVGPNSPAICKFLIDSCGEASLDLQVAQGLATGATSYFWSIEASSADPFVDWLVAMSDAEDTPQVASASYTASESDLPSSEIDNFDQEAQAIALRGTSILISSGDDGAAGSALRTDTSVCDGAFGPEWPATSPYVTAVGATAIEGSDEVTCQSDDGAVITSGGGFSDYYDVPDFQADVVATYLKTADQPDASKFNAGGRGYPDVSLQGFNYTVVVGGQEIGVSGTSASTPAFASMITLINSERLAAGKQSLGYLNNALYALDSSAINDITEGEINCAASSVASQANCCDSAYVAAKGWDATTGLGSVDFTELHAQLLDA